MEEADPPAASGRVPAAPTGHCQGGSRLIRHARYSAAGQKHTGRTPHDADALSADSRAHGLTRVAFDLIAVRTAERRHKERGHLAGVVSERDARGERTPKYGVDDGSEPREEGLLPTHREGGKSWLGAARSFNAVRLGPAAPYRKPGSNRHSPDLGLQRRPGGHRWLCRCLSSCRPARRPRDPPGGGPANGALVDS